MPNPAVPAFTVTGSPVTTSGVLTVTANGTVTDYIDGTGALQPFPTIITYTVDNGLTENPAGNFQLGGTLIQNTTITGANFNFTYTGLNRYLVDVDDFVNISSASGSDSALVDVSTGSATPYVELNVKNGTNTHSIYVDDTQIILRTPGVDAGSVSNGDVLTLIDAASGEVEFQTPTVTGTPVALPFTTDHITATGNPYVIGDVVWYSGNLYICIANNDSILPTNASYWTSLGAGNPLVQQPADWNSTSGNNQILNKPTIPTAQGLQDVIITDPVLTQNNNIDGGNFNLNFNNNNQFNVISDQFIT
ncbi:MAG: hypothetical protein EBU84_19155, partial [Actinobacteria bacterium]|nr:hypothetical protein [Actinomycetota bacterium]